MIFYFRYEKARLDRQRVAEAAKGVGRPKVGGPFELLDQEGKRFTGEDMKGGYSLVCTPGASHINIDRDVASHSSLTLYFFRSISAFRIVQTYAQKN